MRRFLRLFFWLSVPGLVVLLAIILVPAKRSGPVTVLPPGYQPPEIRGLYVAMTAGHYAACHMAPGGEPYAGRWQIASPFGVIYASNIPPGKGWACGWSLDDFRAALQDGLRPEVPGFIQPCLMKITARSAKRIFSPFIQIS